MAKSKRKVYKITESERDEINQHHFVKKLPISDLVSKPIFSRFDEREMFEIVVGLMVNDLEIESSIHEESPAIPVEKLYKPNISRPSSNQLVVELTTEQVEIIFKLGLLEKRPSVYLLQNPCLQIFSRDQIDVYIKNLQIKIKSFQYNEIEDLANGWTAHKYWYSTN